MTSHALVNAKTIQHLAKLLGMLGSEHAGGRASAGLLAHRFVREVLRVTWADVLAPPLPDWQWMARFCRDRPHLLNAHEREFVASMACWRKPPTDKQLAWLVSIHERLRAREAA
jgi:hypothetical protein